MIFKTALNINISNSINQSDFTTSILLNLLFYLAVCLIRKWHKFQIFVG